VVSVGNSVMKLTLVLALAHSESGDDYFHLCRCSAGNCIYPFFKNPGTLLPLHSLKSHMRLHTSKSSVPTNPDPPPSPSSSSPYCRIRTACQKTTLPEILCSCQFQCTSGKANVRMSADQKKQAQKKHRRLWQWTCSR